MFFEATVKFDSHKIFVEVYTHKLSPAKLLVRPQSQKLVHAKSLVKPNSQILIRMKCPEQVSWKLIPAKSSF